MKITRATLVKFSGEKMSQFMITYEQFIFYLPERVFYPILSYECFLHLDFFKFDQLVNIFSSKWVANTVSLP